MRTVKPAFPFPGQHDIMKTLNSRKGALKMISFRQSKTWLHLRPLLILWTLTGVSCLLIFKNFLFGDALAVFADAGSDTKQQYIMQYATIVNHLKNGNYSLWDLNNGFGTSMFALNIANVFLMLVYAAGYLFGVGYIPGVLVYLLILEIFLAVTVCYFFLNCFSFSERSKIIASYLYGLCGYMLVWGQHYQFGAFVVFLPFLLFLLERAIQKRRFSFSVPLLVALMVLASVYMSYMSLILSGFYVIFRLVLEDETCRNRIRQFFLHCASMVLGIGIGAAVFLPMAYYLLTISSRLDSELSFMDRIVSYLSWYDTSFYETAFLRLFSTAFQGIRDYNGYSNFYEAPVLFFSLLFVILALQYVFTIHKQNCPLRRKITQYLAVAFFFFCIAFRLGASIFNAFAYPFSRHSFLFMPLFAVLTAFTLDQILIRHKISIPALLLACIAIAAAHYMAYQQVTEDVLQLSVILKMLCACSLIFLLILGIKQSTLRSRKLISLLLLLACAADVTLEGYLCYNDRSVLSTADPEYWGGLYNPNVTEALNYLVETDSSLYRTEKDYYSGSFCMDALAQGYRGISTYNSTPNRYLEEFIELVIPNFPIMADHEYTFRQIGYYTEHSTLFGIKYLLSRDADLQLNGFTFLAQFGDISVYQNQNVDSIARFYTSVGDSAVLENAYGTLDLERLLLETILFDLEDEADAEAVRKTVGDQVLSNQELTEKYTLEELSTELPNISAGGSESSLSISIDPDVTADYQRVYLEFDIITPEVSDITVNPEEPFEYHFRTTQDTVHHVQIAVPKTYDSVILERYGANLEGEITNLRLLGSKEISDSYAGADILLTDSGNDSLISGTITTEDSGFLFLPIPYENGWSVTIDGEPAQLLRADTGFMGAAIEAGEHEFQFTYEQPCLKTGLIISGLSLVIWLFLLLYHKRRSAK